MSGLFGNLYDKFFTAEGLQQTMADPRFQIGVGLLGRTDMPFGQALGGTMNDMAQQQILQQRFKAQQQAQEQQIRQQQWLAQNMPSAVGAPDWYGKALLDAQLKATEPRVLSPGSVYFDPVTGKPVYSAPTKKDPTTMLHVDPETGEITFTQGGTGGPGLPLGTKGSSQTDSNAMSAIDTLARLKTVADEFKGEYLTYKGQIAAAGFKQADKLGIPIGEDNKKFLAGKTRFTNNVEQLFNAYRKEITGAAASVQELDRLKQSLLNTDMSPIEFEAAFEQFYTLAQRQLSLAVELKAQGITGKRLVEALNADFANMLQDTKETAPAPPSAGVDMGAIDAEIKKRGLKLETGGGF